MDYDGKAKQYFVKRFCIETSTLNKPFLFITAVKGSRLVLATTAANPQLAITYRTSPQAPLQKLQYTPDTLAVQGRKAQGSRLTQHAVTQVTLV